jgi:hypothetical protein
MSTENSAILISGKITHVGAKEQINEKFAKQVFFVQTLDKYPQEYKLETWNKDFNELVGNTGVFYINLRGRSYIRKDGTKDGNNTFQCYDWNID